MSQFYEKLKYKLRDCVSNNLKHKMDALALNDSILAFTNAEIEQKYNSKRLTIMQKAKELLPKKFIYATTFEGFRVFRIE